MILVSAIGIVICFSMLIISCMKNFSTILAAIIGAGIVGVCAGNGFIESISGSYIEGVTAFFKGWVVIFALGGLLGGLYSASGSAWRIGDVLVRKASKKLALMAIIFFGGLLVYSGINPPVALFVILPLARVIFPRIGVPWYLFPGVAGLATCTYSMYLPGSLSVVNLIPTTMLNLPATAAPVEGIAASLFVLILGILYLQWEIRKGANNLEVENPVQYLGPMNENTDDMDKNSPTFLISIIPLALALILVNIVRMDIALSLGAGCVAAIVLFWKYIPQKIQTVSSSFNEGIMPCILVAAIVGIGGVVATTPIFEIAREAILKLPISGLFKIAVSTTLISGICASGAGGAQMTLSVLGNEFLSMGYSPDIIARIVSVACGGLDSMPWNGTIVMMFALSAVSIRKGYKQVFVLTCMLPILASLFASVVYTVIH